MSDEPTERQEKAAEAALARVSEGSEETAEVRVHEDETKEMRTPGFSRMRTDWSSHDGQVMAALTSVVDDRVMVRFPDAYQIINALYDVVRIPRTDDEGVALTDRHGWPLWEVNEYGMPVEDYTRLGIKEREEFLFQITTRLFDWEQRAADAWGEAMFAKAQWEERFALSFLDTSEGGRKTDEAMTQRGRLGSRDERYFALFQSYYSRRVDALVRSLERISQRLKDTL